MKVFSINFLLVINILLFNSCFEIFPKSEKLLDKIKLNEQDRIEAIYVETGATTKDNIKILYFKGKKISNLQTFEGYDWVKMKIISSDTLKLILADSTNLTKPDTVYIDMANN